MAPKLIRFTLILTIIVAALVVLPPAQAHADSLTADTGFPTLPTFTTLVNNGQAGLLRGVYVPDVLADSVVQQPSGMGSFVSPRQGILTQFAAASSLGSIGLLAHNYLAGAKFSQLQIGQVIYLVYGDGTTGTYAVTHVLKYQALQPNSPYSNFIDLSTKRSMTSSQVFSAAYGRRGAVVLQTCIAANGVSTWGRMFVVAEPISN